MSALLDVRDLTTHFATRAGTVKAVEGVSFDLAAGDVVGLVGESGSGKSVTGLSILGLIDPPGRIVAGSVRLAGRSLSARSRGAAVVARPAHRHGVPGPDEHAQSGAHHRGANAPGARGARVCVEGCRAHRSIEALAAVRIPDAAQRLDAYPHQFSGGMRQRVAIAIALLHRPALIVLR